jgi:hypothetical protein
MLKTAYRVRRQLTIEGRLSLDLTRQRRAEDRAEPTKSLHTFTGNTNAYAGETDSGNILITYPINGKFTARFN